MLTKAMLQDNGGGVVHFQFNPSTISFKSAGKLKHVETTGKTQWVGPEPINLTLEMLLDEATGREPVLARLETMLRWTRPKDGKKQPYEVTFSWGTLQIGSGRGLTCHCESVNVKYDLFNNLGIPIRATTTVSLKEIVPPTPPGQNPTSGGELPVRSRMLRSGDDLAVLTHAEYGSTSNWREVASRNSIDNPFRLPLGRELVLPAEQELRGAP